MYHARRVRGSEASARLDKNIEDHCVRMLLLFEPLRERPTRNVFHRNEYLVFEGADVVQCNHVGCESRASACASLSSRDRASILLGFSLALGRRSFKATLRFSSGS